MVSIYNTYWDEKWGGTNGPDGHRAWDNAESAHWLIINPDDIVAGDTIEVDFMFAEKAGEKPDADEPLRVLGEGPNIPGYVVKLDSASNIQLDAWLYFADGNWWPQRTSIDQKDNHVIASDAVVTGQGSYTVGLEFDDTYSWQHPDGAVGISSSYLKIENGEVELPNHFVQITDIRLDGTSVAFNNNLTAPFTWDDSDTNDTAVPLYLGWMNDQDHNKWNRRDWADDATCAVLDPALVNGTGNIEIDFIVTGEAGKQPDVPLLKYDFTYYPNNTVCAAGFSLRDRGVTDKWYHAVPVDLTRNGIYKIPLIASGMHIIGEAIVTVEDGNVTVDYKLRSYSTSYLTLGEECLAWFDDISDITADFCAAPQSNAAFGEPYAIEGMGNVGYLFICNRVTYRQPYTDDGVYLPRYYSGNDSWKNYVANLQAMVDALDAPAAE